MSSSPVSCRSFLRMSAAASLILGSRLLLPTSVLAQVLPAPLPQAPLPLPAAPPPAIAPAHAAFLKEVSANFARWDNNRDGNLAPVEIDAAVSDAKVTGPQAAVAALKRASSSARFHLPGPLTHETIQHLVAGAAPPAVPDRARDSDERDGEDEAAAIAAGPRRNRRTKVLPNLVSLYARALTRIDRSGRRQAVLFASGVPKFGMVRQGPIGDCFCLAPLGALLHRDPQKVAALFRREEDGIFRVALGGKSIAVSLPTDAELALSAAAAPGELWVNVYEKAVGTHRAARLSRPTTPLAAVSRGGSAGTHLSLLTGHRVERFFCRAATGKDATTEAVQAAVQAKEDELRRRLVSAMSARRLVTCGTRQSATPGIQSNHAYAVLAYDADKDTMRLWNPHGSSFTPRGSAGPKNGYRSTGGVFDIPLPDFLRIFSGMAFETGEPAEVPSTPTRFSDDRNDF